MDMSFTKDMVKSFFTKIFFTQDDFYNQNNIFYIGGSEVLPPPLTPEEETLESTLYIMI